MSNAFDLTQAQIRSLSNKEKPGLNEQGDLVMIPFHGKNYRIRDSSPRAPHGFQIYVGPTGAYYEVRIKRQGKNLQIALGSVKDLTKQKAYELAASHRSFVQTTGDDPRNEVKRQAATQKASELTLGDALEAYLDYLAEEVRNRRAKKSSLAPFRYAVERFKRPGVALYSVRLTELMTKAGEARLKAAFNKIRDTSMWESKLLSLVQKELLRKQKEWWNLEHGDLVELGFTGRAVELAYSAGRSSAERAMTCARTALDRVIAADKKRAAQDKTPLIFFYNPFEDVIKSMGRTKKQLNQHYENAAVRNPLSADDGYVQAFMKALLVRRDRRQDRKVASDYLFLTLLWGVRRNESARLRWFESLAKSEVDLKLASWVWLTDDESAINPFTKCAGSQAFFHDTKNWQYLLLPISPFAKQILRMRREDRLRVRKDLQRFQAHTNDPGKKADYAKLLDFNERWVFPAGKVESNMGYYTISSAILHNLRIDTGMLDPENDMDRGLAAHDLRRTLGRFAGRILPGHFVSQLLNHKVAKDGQDMAFMTERYSRQEWPVLREAMDRVEASIIATSPRVWNALLPAGMAPMDDADDPELVVPLTRKNGYDTKANREQRRCFPERKKGGNDAPGGRGDRLAGQGVENQTGQSDR